MSDRGTLYLLPNLLDEELSADAFLPAATASIVESLSGLIAESEKGGRRYARRFVSHERLVQLPIKLLNEHTKLQELDALLAPIRAGEVWGLVSDAGLPCLADPGAALVARAAKGSIRIQITPLAGPSSIIFALQLSGFDGQRFAFHGYLPREELPLREALLQMEKRSRQDRATQIWIEAPYRTAKLMAFLSEVLHPSTLLSVALNLTTSRQRVDTRPVSEWRKRPWEIGKEPAVFLLYIDSSIL